MAREIRRYIWLLAALGAAAPAGTLQAQQTAHTRMGVLIPDLRPNDGANRRFGENVAKELRDLLNTLPTHQPVAKRDMDNRAKSFKIDPSSMDCLTTRQLASQMESPLALCASYQAVPGGVEVTSEFFDVSSGESFKVTPVTVAAGQERAAAQHIFGEFDRYTQQLRAAVICSEYTSSKVWPEAEANCTRALDLNPAAVGPRYLRARVFYETERHAEALADLRLVLEQDPLHEDALQLAGYVSALQGLEKDALEYYSRYLELSPGNAQVRMKIAYDLAQAGDPAGAMQLIQVGLDHDPENVDLWEQFGGFAFAAGQRINEAARTSSEDANTVSPAALTYYRSAIDAYTRVYAAKGAETQSHILRTLVAAHAQLGDLTAALSMAERALATHSQEDALWSVYADALQRAGRLNDALTALNRVREINPEYPNLALRQGRWLLEAGRVQEGVGALRGMAAADPTQADAAGRLVVSHAYSKGIQPKNWDLAITSLNAALGIPGMSAQSVHSVNFWLGYGILQSAIAEQEPRTVETAQATLPKFRRVKELFGNVGSYPRTVNVAMEQLLTAVDQYIEIQDSIIRRGR